MTRSNWSRWLAAGAVLLVCGCAQKLTYQRWEMVNTGDSPDVVKATLGEPWQKTDMTWVYSDDDRHVTAFIYFRDAKVNGKRWEDPEHGSQGASPNVNQPGDAEKLNIKTVK